MGADRRKRSEEWTPTYIFLKKNANRTRITSREISVRVLFSVSNVVNNRDKHIFVTNIVKKCDKYFTFYLVVS